jgi:TRAP-type C4-dicarboxylate transport system substrate-binding protein
MLRSSVCKLIVSAVLAGAPVWVGAQVFKFDMTNDNPPTTLASQGDEFFAALVNKNSQGRIVITVHHSGSLGYKSKDNLDAVGDGAVPMANTFGGFIAGINPMFNISSLPFVTGNPKDAKAAIDVAWPYLNKALAQYKQRLLFTSPFTPVGIWAKKPVTSRDALANLKIRTFDAIGTNILKTAGAAPVQLSFGDIVPQLATGGLDAVFTSAEGGSASKFWEHVGFFTEINYSTGIAFAHMNQASYDKLPPDLRKVIDDAAARTDERNWKELQGRIDQRYAEMKQNGMTIVTNVPPEFRRYLMEASKPEIEKWKKSVGPDAAEMLTKIEANIGK